MKYLDILLQVKNPDRNFIEIILWWEIRRILYNGMVLICGIISMVILITASAGRVELRPGEDLFEPFLIPVFAILCNMGYTLGWLTEIFRKKTLTYGPKMFKVGLLFTLFWVFLPSIIWLVIAGIDEIRKML